MSIQLCQVVHLLADNVSDWDSVVDAFEQLVTYYSTIQTTTMASSSYYSMSSSSSAGGLQPTSQLHRQSVGIIALEDRDIETSCMTIER